VVLIALQAMGSFVYQFFIRIAKTVKMRRYLLLAIPVLMTVQGQAQSLRKPDVPDPSLLKIKQSKGYYGGPGYMGLWDWNFSLGYIDRSARLASAPITPAELNTSGQYFMFHLQDGLLSNYFLAKSYKRDKRFKFGFQNTFDLGVKRGAAASDSSKYVTAKSPIDGDMNFFFNYQAGFAAVLRVTRSLDIGYTYYPYVKSIFHPNSKTYWKARVRYSRFMAEYSFGDDKCFEFKYLRSSKMYIGFSYTENRRSHSDYSYGIGGYNTTNVNTNWIHLSIGRVF
jgi:hypothetical protein